MYFNAREYDRTNAISLIALGGAAISVVYLIFTIVVMSTTNTATDGSSTMTAHLMVSFVLVTTFLVASLVVTPRYERLNATKELIDEFYRIFSEEKVELLSKLTPETDRDIIIHAYSKGRGYGLSVQGAAGLHTLTITREGLVLFSPNSLVQRSTEEFARATLAYLNGDQFALRRVLSKKDSSTVAP